MNPTLPPSIIRLDTVTPKPLSWLWRPRIPAGRLTLMVGHPDRGKSVATCTIGAHVSRSLMWPDGAPCVGGSVIFLEAEDNLEETIVPRLQAAGADLTKIVTWQERSLNNLSAQLTALRPRLLVLSPLNTYLPKINTWHDKEVRSCLQPLADLAATTGTAILGIMHPPKSRQALPIYDVVGSVAFGGVARSVLTVERGENGLHLLEGTKGNLTGIIPPIGYRIRSWEHDPEIAQLVWEVVPSTLSYAPPDEDHSALVEACEYLRMALHDGPEASNDIKRGAENNGIAPRTLARARKILNIHADRVYAGSKSYWQLSLTKASLPPPKTP